jgi:hypothetical protein
MTDSIDQVRKVFDAPPSEDDPLLQEPLRMMPNSTCTFPERTSNKAFRRMSAKGVFTQNKQHVVRKKKRAVSYDSDSHLGVLFQMYGSVWPQVLPYCVLTVVITYLIYYLQSRDIIDLTFSSSNGHTFMAIMVRTRRLLYLFLFLWNLSYNQSLHHHIIIFY